MFINVYIYSVKLIQYWVAKGTHNFVVHNYNIINLNPSIIIKINFKTKVYTFPLCP